MTQREKLLQKFFNKPESIKYSQLRNILLFFGFHEIQAKGSHKKFKHVLIEKDLIIPVHNNECKDFYKKFAAKIVQENTLNQ